MRIHFVRVARAEECSTEEAYTQSDITQSSDARREAVHVSEQICARRQRDTHGEKICKPTWKRREHEVVYTVHAEHLVRC